MGCSSSKSSDVIKRSDKGQKALCFEKRPLDGKKAPTVVEYLEMFETHMKDIPIESMMPTEEGID